MIIWTRGIRFLGPCSANCIEIILKIIIVGVGSSFFVGDVFGMSCGIDNSPVSHVYEGLARIETYPWLGILYYPHFKKRYTTAVVLVTRQVVLATATEVDKLPKHNFRERARVIIGHNCSGPSIGVRDYTYHPDYNRDTFSALAMIQLETDHVKIELRPICPPPTHFSDQNFYAMVLSENCRKSKVRIHKMKYVSPESCKMYYRRTGLDVDTMWPSHTACAKSVTGGRCVWRSGAILVIKVGMRWRLLGFGVYGPGCQAPARFLDYGMYHGWVKRTIDRIGRPAITTLAPNHLVLRRTVSHLQRFGPCDKEETKYEMYSDMTNIDHETGNVKYNISIYSNVEYSCVIFRATYGKKAAGGIPQMRLRRWCAGSTAMCYGFQFLEIHFYVELTFMTGVIFEVKAYGKEAKIINAGLVNKFINIRKHYPRIASYNETKYAFVDMLKNSEYPWFKKS